MLGVLESNPELCAAVDFVGANIQPYFDGGRAHLQRGGAFLKPRLRAAEVVGGGKEGYVIEAGWPSVGKPNGRATTSPEDQNIASRRTRRTRPATSGSPPTATSGSRPAPSRTLATPRSYKHR